MEVAGSDEVGPDEAGPDKARPDEAGPDRGRAAAGDGVRAAGGGAAADDSVGAAGGGAAAGDGMGATACFAAGEAEGGRMRRPRGPPRARQVPSKTCSFSAKSRCFPLSSSTQQESAAS